MYLRLNFYLLAMLFVLTQIVVSKPIELQDEFEYIPSKTRQISQPAPEDCGDEFLRNLQQNQHFKNYVNEQNKKQGKSDQPDNELVETYTEPYSKIIRKH